MITVQQAIGGIYILLRRPSDIKLNPDDVLKLINDDLRGRVQDLSLAGRDLRSETMSVTIDEDDIDYLLRVPDVPDFEPVRLEYSSFYSGAIAAWQDAAVVTPASWANHFDGPRVAASFYGSSALQEGTKLRLNIDPGTLGNYQWRLTYRRPLLNIVQTGERPPIPSDFVPMVEKAVAIKAMPIVNDNTDEWIKWMARTIPVYAAELLQWEERWQKYLDTSVEPFTQPIRPFNYFRQRRVRNTRAYLPLGSG